MGLFADMLAIERKEERLASVPAWDVGRPKDRTGISFERAYLDGYSSNEIVYGCLEVIADTATEPSVIAERGPEGNAETLEMHPASELINNPNPFDSEEDLIGLLQVDLGLAGNHYQHKVRSRRGVPVELWRLRPDRVRVVPDRDNFIRGYVYRIDDGEFFIEPQDLIHFKARDPFNPFYGMPALMPAAGRVDIDAFMRQFVRAFFENAAVPFGLLTMNKMMTRSERRLVREQLSQDFGGPGGWHNTMVVEGDGSAKYQAMGLPIGSSGVALPELDEIDETRIAGVFRVPQSLVGTRLGNKSAAYANRKSDREHFWQDRQAPEFRRMGGTYTRGLKADWPDIDRIRFDLGGVLALQEDKNELHARVRADLGAGILGQEEARRRLGYDNDIDPDDTFLIPSATLPTRADDLVPGDGDNGEPGARDAEELAALINSASGLIRSGFEPAAALEAVGLDPIAHIGLLPVTVQRPE